MSALALLAIALSPAKAGTLEALGTLPPAVSAAIAENKATCRETVHVGAAFLRRVDVNGDGVPDYLLDYSAWTCGVSPPDFCGSAGCLTQLFVSRPRGGFDRVFDENGRLSFFRLNGRPAMRVGEAGLACGRSMDAMRCVETRVWNGHTFVRVR